MADDVTLRMLLVGEDKSASKALKNVGKAANGAAKESTIAGSALKGIIAGVSIHTAVKVLGDLRDAGEAAATANARIEQVFRSMGATTDDAAKAQEKYADELARQTGVDQNVIKLTQAKLATFKAVSNQLALDEGIFKRATDAAVDLAATGFGSAETNAAQLGKALQDPVKGLTALRKAGITFTDQEKDQIATLVKSGKTLEAQKKVLAAIESQVGGVAKATANASDIQAVAWSQAQEALGERLLPAYEQVTEAVVNLTGAVQDNNSVFTPTIDIVTGLATVLNDVSKSAADTTSAFGMVFDVLNRATGVTVVQDLLNAYKDSESRSAGMAKGTEDVAGALKASSAAAKAATAATEDNTDANKDNATSLNKVFNARLKLRGDKRALQAAYDDATASIKENGKTLDINTEKGRANQAALDGIASAAQAVPSQMKQARTHFISTAMAMGKSRAEAVKMANSLGLIPAKAKAAANKLADLQAKAKALNGKKITFSVSAAMNKAADEIAYSVKGHGSLKFTARALGGPVYRGQPYVVGERGWEVFVPDQTGKIMNQQQLSRSGSAMGGDVFQISMDFRGATDGRKVARDFVSGLRSEVRARRGRPFDVKAFA